MKGKGKMKMAVKKAASKKIPMKAKDGGDKKGMMARLEGKEL